jgi:cell division cycle 2-like protein
VQLRTHYRHAGFPITSLREINVLLALSHENVVELHEIVVGARLSSIYMVMEYMDHDLKMVMTQMKRPFRPSEVKCLLQQLLRGVLHLHEHWILHRDLKTSNILFNNKGVLKICDMGLARRYEEPIGKYTQLVVTLW